MGRSCPQSLAYTITIAATLQPGNTLGGTSHNGSDGSFCISVQDGAAYTISAGANLAANLLSGYYSNHEPNNYTADATQATTVTMPASGDYSGAPIQFTLPRGGQVIGKITSKATGKALAGVSVTAGHDTILNVALRAGADMYGTVLDAKTGAHLANVTVTI